ncbi:FHA domain-containing protein, partial [Stieleria sp. ICT_E10.1]|uniref:FHA domain-containing protein n=1 Tax=Stieleria sedimenti TaxID=2976331 RepID=UPI002180449B
NLKKHMEKMLHSVAAMGLAMKIVLEIIAGAYAGRKKALRAPLVLVVGRGESADWILPDDTTMSSRHFEVSVNQDGCFVTDLNSTNGTTVDGERILQRPLDDGNEIRAGSTVFRVSMTRRASLSPPITGQPSSVNRHPPESTTDSPGQPLPPASAPVPAAPLSPQQPLPPPQPPAPPVSMSEVLRQTERIGRTETDGAAMPANSGGVAERTPEFHVSNPPPRRFTGAVIEVVSDHAHGRKSMLRSGHSITVGRSEQSDFVIPDPQLSAIHFQLADDRSGWQLTDLDSTSGTTVNGVRVSTTLLQTGDRVIAGQTHFVVTIGESAPLAGGREQTNIPFQVGVRDEDPQVRRTAIHAAAWSREPWLLDFCRGCAKAASPEQRDTLEMLSVLGLPSDLELIRGLGRRAELGPNRFELLASFAHPAVVPDLIQVINGDQLEDAVAASLAFSRILGVDIASGQRATVMTNESGDGDDEEFDEQEVMVPDAAKAERHWADLAESFASGNRFHQGIETSGPPTPDLLQQLDMRSRWEMCVRGKYEGKWNGDPFDLERLINP